MYQRAKTYTLMRPRLKKTLGIFLVLFGLFGLIAPVVPGAIIVFIGLELLGLRFLFMERLLGRQKVAPVTVPVSE